ncbi:MAG: metallophosphoesterase [Oscillospiraceae bacterium]|nr:metallophosphoesterase [Oscillospiraceae bacterium]
MALFAIADTHLSFGTPDKRMSVFKGWDNHAERLHAGWNGAVGVDDTVVIAGDVSWAQTLTEATADLRFIDSLNGSKIILRGNHDYWWTTLTKMRRLRDEQGLHSIEFLHNNAYKVGNAAVCGTRGWLNESDAPIDTKMTLREAARLERSIQAGLAQGVGEVVVFLHYPPVYAYEENAAILEVLRKYAVRRVFAGHIHLSGMPSAFKGERYGICFDMITADSLKFVPQKVL